jgi:hypothetical protein
MADATQAKATVARFEVQMQDLEQIEKNSSRALLHTISTKIEAP